MVVVNVVSDCVCVREIQALRLAIVGYCAKAFTSNFVLVFYLLFSDRAPCYGVLYFVRQYFGRDAACMWNVCIVLQADVCMSVSVNLILGLYIDVKPRKNHHIRKHISHTRSVIYFIRALI